MLTRREVVAGATFASLAPVGGRAFGQAAWVPTKDVEFVIPFAVGGGADIMARVIHKVITEDKLVPVPMR